MCRVLTKSLVLLVGLVSLASFVTSSAEAKQSSLHYMGCYGHNFAGETLIDSGWGYHALYWKACQAQVPFNEFSANPPISITSFADDDLNAQEANASVFPNGDPSGGWGSDLVSTKEELLLIAAIYMDRWDSPLYVEVDIDGDGFSQETVIRAVQYSGTDPATACGTWGWNDDNQDPRIVAANCSFFEGPFNLSFVDVAYWDFFEFVEATVSGSQFPTLCFSETYVADPPEGAAERFRKNVDHFAELRQEFALAVPQCDL